MCISIVVGRHVAVKGLISILSCTCVTDLHQLKGSCLHLDNSASLIDCFAAMKMQSLPILFLYRGKCQEGDCFVACKVKFMAGHCRFIADNGTRHSIFIHRPLIEFKLVHSLHRSKDASSAVLLREYFRLGSIQNSNNHRQNNIHGPMAFLEPNSWRHK